MHPSPTHPHKRLDDEMRDKAAEMSEVDSGAVVGDLGRDLGKIKTRHQHVTYDKLKSKQKEFITLDRIMVSNLNKHTHTHIHTYIQTNIQSGQSSTSQKNEDTSDRKP
jgi:hypothetical protein